MSSSPWESCVIFDACSAFMEAVAKDTDKKRKMLRLGNFLDKCRAVAKEKEGKDASMFPVVRLLMPALDRERGAYGIKETAFARLYVDLLKLSPTSSDAIKLKNYR